LSRLSNFLQKRTESAVFGPKVRTKTLGEVSITPPLMQIFQALDGSPVSYGSIYLKLAPVRTVVAAIANAYATTPLKVYRRTPQGRPEVYDHPLAVLLRNPNPDMSEFFVRWRLIADLLVYGNAYWRKMQVGRVRSLIPLPPYRVTPQGGDLLRAATYDFFGPNGRPPQTFSREEIVHFRLYHPEEPRIGASPIEAIRNILLEEVEASAYRRGYWANNAALTGVLKHPEQLSNEAKERLREQFDNTYAGHSNAGRSAVLEEGMDWEQITSTAREAEFIEGRKFVLEATARAYNFPLPLLSLTDSVAYAAQREMKVQLYTETLPPWFEAIQSEIELQVLPWFTDTDGIYVEHVVESKLRGDFIDRMNVMNTAIGRPWMTVQEGRDLDNLPNRGEPSDRQLVIPVGPNYALEGQAEEAALASVSELPVAASLGAFFDRQERSVQARLAAKHAKPFDRARWDRELASLIGKTNAETINTTIEIGLRRGDDVADVFAHARRQVAS